MYSVTVQNPNGSVVGGPARLEIQLPKISLRRLAGGAIEVSWSGCAECVPQTSDSLTNPSWRIAPEYQGGQLFLISTNRSQAYFRLALLSPQPILNAPRVLAGVMVLSWASCGDCVLQTTDTLTNPVWTNIPESRGTNNFQVPITGKQRYFRLAVGQ
jgi:hypothetical protein